MITSKSAISDLPHQAFCQSIFIPQMTCVSYPLIRIHFECRRTEDEIDGGPSHGHQSLDFTDETQTGQVGTALYVAPELMVSGGKASYNQV